MDGVNGESKETEVLPVSGDEANETEVISSPAKVLRIGSMIKGLLEEVRSFNPDETGAVAINATSPSRRETSRDILGPRIS